MTIRKLWMARLQFSIWKRAIFCKFEGRVKQTAKEIADLLKKRFEEQGWLK